jgi:dual-specificity kinase
MYNCLQGEALFQTHENLEHLAMMERVLGPLPQHMLKRVECVLF